MLDAKRQTVALLESKASKGKLHVRRARTNGSSLQCAGGQMPAEHQGAAAAACSAQALRCLLRSWSLQGQEATFAQAQYAYKVEDSTSPSSCKREHMTCE